MNWCSIAVNGCGICCSWLVSALLFLCGVPSYARIFGYRSNTMQGDSSNCNLSFHLNVRLCLFIFLFFFHYNNCHKCLSEMKRNDHPLTRICTSPKGVLYSETHPLQRIHCRPGTLQNTLLPIAWHKFIELLCDVAFCNREQKHLAMALSCFDRCLCWIPLLCHANALYDWYLCAETDDTV